MAAFLPTHLRERMTPRDGDENLLTRTLRRAVTLAHVNDAPLRHAVRHEPPKVRAAMARYAASLGSSAALAILDADHARRDDRDREVEPVFCGRTGRRIA